MFESYNMQLLTAEFSITGTPKRACLYDAVEPRYNKPLYNEHTSITNNIFQPINSKIYGKRTQSNKPPLKQTHFSSPLSGFHCTSGFTLWLELSIHLYDTCLKVPISTSLTGVTLNQDSYFSNKTMRLFVHCPLSFHPFVSLE